MSFLVLSKHKIESLALKGASLQSVRSDTTFLLVRVAPRGLRVAVELMLAR